MASKRLSDNRSGLRRGACVPACHSRNANAYQLWRCATAPSSPTTTVLRDSRRAKVLRRLLNRWILGIGPHYTELVSPCPIGRGPFVTFFYTALSTEAWREASCGAAHNDLGDQRDGEVAA